MHCILMKKPISGNVTLQDYHFIQIHYSVVRLLGLLWIIIPLLNCEYLYMWQAMSTCVGVYNNLEMIKR